MSSEQTLKQRKQLVDQLSRKGKDHAVVKALIKLYTLKFHHHVSY